MSSLHRLFLWLRKPSSSVQLVPQMEGLRFVALLAVFCLHFEQTVHYKLENDDLHGLSAWIASLCSVGDFGVQLFFAVSGFVLALPFARWRLLGAKPVKLRDYFMRRLWRLEPPLLINLLILLPIAVWVVKKVTLMEGLRRFALTMSYLHYATLGEMSPINRVTWSLETEAQFYLAMPCIALLFKMGNPVWRRTALVVLSAVCMACKVSLNKALLPAQFEYFAVGIVLADLYLTGWSSKLGISKGWDVVGLCSWVAMPVTLIGYSDTGSLGRSWILAALAFLAFSATLRGRVGNRLAAGSVVTFIGGMCYSFYLYHDPVLKLSIAGIRRLLPETYLARFGVELLIMLPLVLLVTLVMYAAFERPFMGRKRKAAAANPPKQESFSAEPVTPLADS